MMELEKKNRIVVSKLDPKFKDEVPTHPAGNVLCIAFSVAHAAQAVLYMKLAINTTPGK